MWRILAALFGLVAVSCSTACGSFAGDCSGGVYSDGRCVSTQPAIHWTDQRATAAAMKFSDAPQVPGRPTEARCRIVHRYEALNAKVACTAVYIAPNEAARMVYVRFTLSGIGVVNADCSFRWRSNPFCKARNIEG
jgi:hypothetical protein